MTSDGYKYKPYRNVIVGEMTHHEAEIWHIYKYKRVVTVGYCRYCHNSVRLLSELFRVATVVILMIAKALRRLLSQLSDFFSLIGM
jgi:hypothetical protein